MPTSFFCTFTTETVLCPTNKTEGEQFFEREKIERLKSQVTKGSPMSLGCTPSSSSGPEDVMFLQSHRTDM